MQKSIEKIWSFVKKYWSYVIPILSYLYFCRFLNNRVDFIINPDNSSELILSKILSDEGKIITDSWYYSTEIRVLNTQLIFSTLFKFTDNWHIVRVVGTCILAAMMMLAMYYFSCQAGFKKYAPFLCSAVILPLCYDYYIFVLNGAYYIPHITFALLIMGMLFHMLRTKRTKVKIALMMCNSVIAVFMGMGGFRQILEVYLPMVLTAVVLWIVNVEKKKELFEIKTWFLNEWNLLAVSSVILLFFSVMGCAINLKILYHKYYFSAHGSIAFKQIMPNDFFTIFNGFLNSFGYRMNAVFSKALLQNAYCLLLVFTAVAAIVLFVKKNKKLELIEQFIILYFVTALICFSGVYLCTTMVPYEDRYNIQILLFVFPMLLIVLKQCNVQKIRTAAIFGTWFALIVCSYWTYDEVYLIDCNAELRQIVKAVEDNGLEEGYASFWHGNNMTELSNGRIDVRVWADYAQDVTDINQVFKWLQKVEHSYTTPEGSFFCVFNAQERNTWTIAKKMEGMPVIYESDQYVVYKCDSYQQVAQQLQN